MFHYVSKLKIHENFYVKESSTMHGLNCKVLAAEFILRHTATAHLELENFNFSIAFTNLCLDHGSINVMVASQSL